MFPRWPASTKTNLPCWSGIITTTMCPARTRRWTWRWTNLPFANGDATLTQYRIDADHSNSYAAWLRMGSPLPLSAEQYAQLEKAGQLAELKSPQRVRVKNGRLDLHFELPRQAVSLLVLTWM